MFRHINRIKTCCSSSSSSLKRGALASFAVGSGSFLWITTSLDNDTHQPTTSTRTWSTTSSYLYKNGYTNDIPHRKTVMLNNGGGIRRYDVAQLSSNDPCEDVHTEATLPVPNGWWSLFTVLDGHSGPETAWWLRENLIAAVAGALADLYNNSMSNTNNEVKHEPTSKDIESTLKQTFVQLDDNICKESVDAVFRNDSSTPVADAIHHLAPAYAGSCALLAFYDSHSRLLHVAVTGDSRAVLGRRTSTPAGDTVYETHILSIDQNGYNPAEAARLTAAHPGETVVKDGRVMGMGMARSFGDARWKWDVETQKRLKKEFLGRSVPRGVITPPYLTAEPEVISIKVQPGDFLIMASDGLWECLDNEDAVGLVGWWLGSSASNSLGKSRQQMEEDPLRGVLPTELPVHREPDAKPEVSVRYGQWNKTKSFINQDSNASAHLIRNALGGAHSDIFTALLAMRAPKSRTFRDDMTATVVFFDDV